MPKVGVSFHVILVVVFFFFLFFPPVGLEMFTGKQKETTHFGVILLPAP